MKILLPIFLMTACCVLQADEEASKSTQGRPVMTVDPQKRAQDYIQAFELMRKEKTSNKVLIHLTDGSSLTNVIEMAAIGNGTLIHFKTNTPQGIKIQIVEVEKILSITHI